MDFFAISRPVQHVLEHATVCHTGISADVVAVALHAVPPSNVNYSCELQAGPSYGEVAQEHTGDDHCETHSPHRSTTQSC